MVPRLILSSLLLALVAGCAVGPAPQPEVVTPEIEVETTFELPSQSVAQLQISIADLTGCSDFVEIELGLGTSSVCDDALIQHWETEIPAEGVSPWLVWCQAVLAPEQEQPLQVRYGKNFIISLTADADVSEAIESESLCDDLADTVTANTADAVVGDAPISLITSFAESGLCFERPRFVPGDVFRAECLGFGTGASELLMWLEFGEIETKALEYSAECGDIFGTRGDSWLVTTYEGNGYLTTDETLADRLLLVSPLPFELLCS